MSETTALAVATQSAEMVPTEYLQTIGAWLAETGAYGCKNKAQGCILYMNCRAEGISPAEHNRRYHNIDGKQCPRTDWILSRFMDLGGKVKWIRFDNQMAVAKWTYGDNVDLEIKYTLEEAKQYGLVRPGSQWAKDSGAMCRARLIARAARMVCPQAITGGAYSAEEMMDMRDMPASAPGGMVAVQVEAPKTIAPEEVTLSAPITAGPAGIEDPPQVNGDGATDYDIIPIGQRKGEKFTDQTAKYLATFVAKAEGKEGVEAGHIERAKAVLAEKEGAK